MATIEICPETPADEFGRCDPYAVFHVRWVEPGYLKESVGLRNLRYADAVAYAERLAEDPNVVSVHVSVDTCG